MKSSRPTRTHRTRTRSRLLWRILFAACIVFIGVTLAILPFARRSLMDRAHQALDRELGLRLQYQQIQLRPHRLVVFRPLLRRAQGSHPPSSPKSESPLLGGAEEVVISFRLHPRLLRQKGRGLITGVHLSEPYLFLDETVEWAMARQRDSQPSQRGPKPPPGPAPGVPTGFHTARPLQGERIATLLSRDEVFRQLLERLPNQLGAMVGAGVSLNRAAVYRTGRSPSPVALVHGLNIQFPVPHRHTEQVGAEQAPEEGANSVPTAPSMTVNGNLEVIGSRANPQCTVEGLLNGTARNGLPQMDAEVQCTSPLKIHHPRIAATLEGSGLKIHVNPDAPHNTAAGGQPSPPRTSTIRLETDQFVIRRTFESALSYAADTGGGFGGGPPLLREGPSVPPPVVGSAIINGGLTGDMHLIVSLDFDQFNGDDTPGNRDEEETDLSHSVLLDVHLTADGLSGAGRLHGYRIPMDTLVAWGQSLPHLRSLRRGELDVQAQFAFHHRRLLYTSGRVELTGTTVRHPHLSSNPVHLGRVKAAGEALLDPWAGTLHLPNLQLQLNRLPAVVTAWAEGLRSTPWVSVRAQTAGAPIAGSDLVRSIPAGMIPNLRGLRLDGTFRIGVELDLDWDWPEDIHLKVDMDTSRLKVVDMGRHIDLERLHSTFLHRVETPHGEHEFKLGPQSPLWTPLEEIPPTLRHGILAQEDGGFFRHNGFSMLHIRGSIVRNIRDGGMTRGASTLSMQTTKNIFLSREKTFSRKLEEAFLTWQLEEHLTKEEILELYLNAIEFAPNVFGIHAASYHYFNHHPSQLSPLECAYLVSIVPGPSRYQRAFQRGEVTRWHSERIRRLMALLVERDLLDEEEYLRAAPYQPLFVTSTSALSD